MKKAFTMIELLVVIGIIGILMAVLLGTFSGSSESARSAKCLANMRNLALGVQAYGVEKECYPYAGSFKKYKSTSSKETEDAPGWISWTKNGNYLPKNKEEDEYCITNGTIWAYMKGARECYVCPVYSEKGVSLGWSYAMNAYFGWASKKSSRYFGCHGKKYPLRRADRHLLFAEIASSSGAGSDAATAEKESDPILQYPGCDGGGDEEIAFNHKDGKYSIAHVCFADGHVEKLREPTDGNVRDLTKWLCRPVDDKGQDFDISFDGKKYQKVQ